MPKSTATVKRATTPAQLRVLRALHRLLKKNPAPSLSEWATVAGEGGKAITTTAIVQHFAKLKALGLVTNTLGRTRSTRITPAGLKAINVKG
jgi:hypothetical protein